MAAWRACVYASGRDHRVSKSRTVNSLLLKQVKDELNNPLHHALIQTPSAWDPAQAVSVECPALSRTYLVVQQYVGSNGESALATLLASAHVPPRVATADDVPAPTSHEYIYQESSCFSHQLTF